MSNLRNYVVIVYVLLLIVNIEPGQRLRVSHNDLTLAREEES